MEVLNYRFRTSERLWVEEGMTDIVYNDTVSIGGVLLFMMKWNAV